MTEESTGTEKTGPRPLEGRSPIGDGSLDALARLLEIVDRLRAPDGCPWDLEQTVASMASSLVEEAFEAVEAIDRIAEGAESTAGDGDVIEELGDLLMVICLIAKIAAQEGRFDLGLVATRVADKLVRRHPHVFGDLEIDGSEVAIANWEKIKQAERREKKSDASALAGVPVALPALQRADRLAAKSISAGFRWSDSQGAFAKLREEVEELADVLADENPAPDRVESELGDVFLACAFLGHYLKVDPERAARRALRRFEERFRSMEDEIEGPLSKRTLEELLGAWRRAKARTDT
jgi:MazG family protein